MSPLPQNGDYNKPIPAQYMEHLNHVVSSAPSPCVLTQPQQWVSSQVLLCRRCSHHQTTKIKQLAAFAPRDEVSPGREEMRGLGCPEQAGGGPCGAPLSARRAPSSPWPHAGPTFRVLTFCLQ